MPARLWGEVGDRLDRQTLGVQRSSLGCTAEAAKAREALPQLSQLPQVEGESHLYKVPSDPMHVRLYSQTHEVKTEGAGEMAQ